MIQIHQNGQIQSKILSIKITVTRTIHYVYEDGSKAKDDVTETLYFKRFAYVNLVTGHVDYRPMDFNMIEHLTAVAYTN